VLRLLNLRGLRGEGVPTRLLRRCTDLHHSDHQIYTGVSSQERGDTVRRLPRSLTWLRGKSDGKRTGRKISSETVRALLVGIAILKLGSLDIDTSLHRFLTL
jgi:hypothetical protein